MRKVTACMVTSSFLLLTSLPGMAQRGLLGGRASMSSRTSSMSQAGIETTSPRMTNVRANTRTNTQTRSNARAKTRSMDRAETSQSANTKADSKRNFTIAPGVEKAEANSSTRTNVHGQTNTNVKAGGLARADASQNVNAGASTHTSLGGKIKHHLHL
ncbi:MAG: hypothetical protein ACYDA9_16395 [Terriglobia bacterium]